MEFVGVGVLMVLLEECWKKLVVEGLFDEVYKKVLFYLLDMIGVVIFESGVVICDIMYCLVDCFL